MIRDVGITVAVLVGLWWLVTIVHFIRGYRAEKRRIRDIAERGEIYRLPTIVRLFSDPQYPMYRRVGSHMQERIQVKYSVDGDWEDEE